MFSKAYKTKADEKARRIGLLTCIREKLEMEAMATMEARTQQTQWLKNTERGDAEWKVNDPRKRRAVL